MSGLPRWMVTRKMRALLMKSTRRKLLGSSPSIHLKMFLKGSPGTPSAGRVVLLLRGGSVWNLSQLSPFTSENQLLPNDENQNPPVTLEETVFFQQWRRRRKVGSTPTSLLHPRNRDLDGIS
ncbi:hypothetical protein LWI29_012637 [Acer saccharum]|uniref:Uncharacterized protein n=1 Tax=Acer saccharum TaxID=4024 RepID=A0AA39VX37_ACESA|nr:hypothetical protein LWI29_012637 [Acer saccharum]